MIRTAAPASTDIALLRIRYEPRTPIESLNDAAAAVTHAYMSAWKRGARPPLTTHLMDPDLVGATASGLRHDRYSDSQVNDLERARTLQARGEPLAALVTYRRVAARQFANETTWNEPDATPLRVGAPDAEAALRQVSALYATAVALADPDVIDEAAERFRFCESLVTHEPTLAWSATAVHAFRDATPPHLPVVSLRMESPFSVLSQIPPDFIAGGGITALLALIAKLAKLDNAAMKVATFPVRVSERWAYHRSEQAKWELALAQNQRRVIEEQAAILRATADLLAPKSIELLDSGTTDDQMPPATSA